MIFTLLVAISTIVTAPVDSRADAWPSLEDYVSRCVLIVKCKTENKGMLKFRVLETWKGKYSPDFFDPKPPQGFLFADRWHGNDSPVDGRDVIFFFTEANQSDSGKGKLVRHSTCFNIENGKLVYATTSESGKRREYTVDAFKKAIANVVANEAVDSTAVVAAPTFSIQQAIELAEDHVKQKKIDVSHMHIASVVYEAEKATPQWKVLWKPNKPVKGGWFAVLVGPDKSIKTEYGE